MDCVVHAILQARILEWVVFPFSRGSSNPRNRTQVSCIASELLVMVLILPFMLELVFFVNNVNINSGLSSIEKLFFCIQSSPVQSLSRVQLFATPWIAARQASLSITNSGSLLKPTSIKSVMPSNRLILCRPLLLLPQSLPASGSFPMSQLFAWGGRSTGVSASASVPPMNTQDWSPSGWTGWTSLQSFWYSWS